MEVVFSTERNPTINVRLRGNLPLWRLSHLEITAFTGLVSEHSVLKAKKTELKNLGKGGNESFFSLLFDKQGDEVREEEGLQPLEASQLSAPPCRCFGGL